MKHLKFGYPLFGALAAVIGMTACADESPWGNTSNEKGSISLSLTTDSGIATAKPVFRSGENDETRATGDANDLNTYITLPSVDDFEITLTNSSGKSTTWSTYKAFKEAASKEQFAADIYTLKASKRGYDPDENVAEGQEHSKNGFNCYYFEGSTTFTVIPNRTTEIDLTAELKKSMVKVNFDQTFIDYVEDDFSAYVHNSDDNKLIPFGKDETKIAFIDPSTTELTAHFTTKTTGKEQTATVKIGDFEAVAKTLHNLTLAIDNSDNGFAKLTVNFDETVEGTKDVNIDLSDELYDTPAPNIECNGFANNDYIDITGGIADGTKYSMSVTAPGGLKTANLTIDGKTLGGKGTFDLLNTEHVTTLTSGGIAARNFTSESKIAIIDFTEFVKQISAEEKCTIMLTVTDQKDKTYVYTDPQGNEIEGAKVTFDKKAVTLKRIVKGDGTSYDEDIIYGSNQAVVNLEYNGDPNDLSFTTSDGKTVTASQSEVIETRALENKWYKYTLGLPYSKCEKVTVIAKYKGTEAGRIELPVDVPKYSITQSDAYNNYAYLKVEANKPNELQTILDNLEIEIKCNGTKFADANISKDNSNGVVTLTNLTPSTYNPATGQGQTNTYAISSSITGGETWNAHTDADFATEAERPIPNGDFTQINDEKLAMSDLKVGGDWQCGSIDYQTTSSFSYDTPYGWATVNELTAWQNSTKKNTWYIVPSTFVTDNKQALLRSVGYNHDGADIDKSGKFLSSTHYCTNTPSKLDIAAGELFLGTYIFNGKASKTEGIGFASRPQKISFDYQYTPIDNNDKGYAFIDIFDADGNPIGNKQAIALDASSENKTVTVDFNYSPFGKKAAKLNISFKSSNQGTPPIHTPTEGGLDENVRLPGLPPYVATISANSYHAVATGSVLKIDNVTAHYNKAPETTPAAAPKRKTTKKK